MQITTNELNIVLKIIKEDIVDVSIYHDCKLIVKYYSTIEVKAKKDIELILHNFISKNTHKYIKDHWISRVKSYVRKNYKEKLIQIDKIVIFKDEINEIKAIGNINVQKILFSFLVYAKINNKLNENSNTWTYQNSIDVFKDAGVKMTEKKREFLINEFVNSGLLKLNKVANKNHRKVMYYKEDGDIALEITNFNRIDVQYEKHINSHIKSCEVCGERVEITTSAKYCSECAKQEQLRLAREYKKKIRFGQ